MNKKQEKGERNKRFYDRMKLLGYDDVTQFVKRSKIDMSFETCRRIINENRQDVRYEYVVALMQELDFTPEEISFELKKRGDKHIHKLVSDSRKGTILTARQNMIFDKMKKDSSLEDLVIRVIERDKGNK